MRIHRVNKPSSSAKAIYFSTLLLYIKHGFFRHFFLITFLYDCLKRRTVKPLNYNILAYGHEDHEKQWNKSNWSLVARNLSEHDDNEHTYKNKRKIIIWGHPLVFKLNRVHFGWNESPLVTAPFLLRLLMSEGFALGEFQRLICPFSPWTSCTFLFVFMEWNNTVNNHSVQWCVAGKNPGKRCADVKKILQFKNQCECEPLCPQIMIPQVYQHYYRPWLRNSTLLTNNNPCIEAVNPHPSQSKITVHVNILIVFYSPWQEVSPLSRSCLLMSYTRFTPSKQVAKHVPDHWRCFPAFGGANATKGREHVAAACSLGANVALYTATQVIIKRVAYGQQSHFLRHS